MTKESFLLILISLLAFLLLIAIALLLSQLHYTAKATKDRKGE